MYTRGLLIKRQKASSVDQAGEIPKAWVLLLRMAGQSPELNVVSVLCSSNPASGCTLKEQNRALRTAHPAHPDSVITNSRMKDELSIQ